MEAGYIRTIEDMERLYYGAGTGQNAWAYSGTNLLKADSLLCQAQQEHTKHYLVAKYGRS